MNSFGQRPAEEFLRRTIRHWGLFVSGAFSSILGWILSTQSQSQLPVVALVAAGNILMVFAMFRAFNDVCVERDLHLEKIDALTRSRPRLVCAGQKCIPIFRPRENQGSVYVFDALQMWIRNEPINRTVDSPARNVSVRSTFYSVDGNRALFSVGEQWVLSTDPDNAGFSGIAQSIDIPANDNAAKFFLVLQHTETDDDCFAHSFGKLQGHPDGRFPPYRLLPGRYKVVVALKGDNVEQEIVLYLVNNGLMVDPEVEGVPKQGDYGPSKGLGEPNPD